MNVVFLVLWPGVIFNDTMQQFLSAATHCMAQAIVLEWFLFCSELSLVYIQVIWAHKYPKFRLE